MSIREPVTDGGFQLPQITMFHQLSILSRTPARILAAQTDTELHELLGSVLRSLFRAVLRFDLFVHDGDDGLVPIVKLGEGQFGAGLKLLAQLRSRLLMKDDDVRLGEGHALPGLQGVRRGSLLSAPLLDGETLIGLIVVEGVVDAVDFSTVDLEVLERVASLFSLALQRLRGREVEHERALIQLDLKRARRVQRRFMSEKLPPTIGVTALAEYLPCFDVGGDFYHVAHRGDGVVGAVIGDVSGKGVSAALVMSHVSASFRHALRRPGSPAEILTAVNADLQDVESETFITASCVAIDAPQRRMMVSSAGHIPLIVRRATGEVFACGRASGTPLGMLECEYADEVHALSPLDIVLLMTDGLVEALDRPSDRMGMTLLLGVVKYAPHDPKLLLERILTAVEKMKGTKLLDDVTLVALQLDA